MRFAVVLVIVVLAGTACRAPGEPASHPAQGEYQDLIRRELDSAGNALAASELVLRYVDADRLPDAYAAVSLRQTANDLRKVAQDLRKIHAPQRATRAQALLLAICQRDGGALAAIHAHLDNKTQRNKVRSRLARDANLLDKQLAKKLDPS